MSKRIKLLAQHAEQLADDELAHLERVHNRLYSFTEGREIYNQKFAELLIRECMDLASAEQKRYANITHRNMNECAVALGNFSLLMKDHFEDEE